MNSAASEAAKPTHAQRRPASAPDSREDGRAALRRNRTAATNISRYMIRYTCVVMTEKIQYALDTSGMNA